MILSQTIPLLMKSNWLYPGFPQAVGDKKSHDYVLLENRGNLKTVHENEKTSRCRDLFLLSKYGKKETFFNRKC